MIETVLPPPASIPVPRRARSTILLSSIEAIRASGFGAAYEAALPPAQREILLGAIAGVWLPFESAVAHYQACEGLNLPHEVQIELGRSVEQRTRGTLTGTLVRMAKGAGASPWTLLPQLQRIWERAFDGGAVVVRKHGPKDAEIDVLGFPLCDIPYFRTGLRAVCTGLLEMVAEKAYMQERRGPRSPGSLHYRAQWV